MLAKGQITVTNLDDGKTPFLHQAYKMKDGRFLKHYPVYEAPPVNGYKEGDLWHWRGEDYPGRNLILGSSSLSRDNLAGGARQEYGVVDTGKSYMSTPSGTPVRISFDLEMKVNTANPSLIVYNSNRKGPKWFNDSQAQLPPSSVGNTIKGRISIVVNILDRVSPTLQTNSIEFYSIYGTSNWWKVSSTKMEKVTGGLSGGTWSPAPEDLTGGKQSGYFVANKSNTTFDFNDWTFYADELAYSDTDKFYPKFEGTYSDYNEVASDDQTKYTWKIIKGDDGIGIKSVKEYYATSTSNITPPSLPSDWSETPKVTDTTNKYLWNYEVYTYSNGDARETTKRVIGTHGTTGATGNGIVSVTNRYLATTLATGVTTATSGWTTAVQATDSVKKYLWNYEEILYTNGSKIPTIPVIIGTHGEKGDNSVIGLLTNESITLPANKDGLVSSFTGATGVFDVYDGITKKTGTGTAYSIVTQSNITVSINATTGAYTVTAMPTGTAILSGYATLRAIYNGVTIEKQLNVSKAVTGATGATGSTGAPGVSSYTWIRYSPNANGSAMTTTPASNSLYIGVTTTTTNSDPTDYTVYTWALIKGSDGKGVKSTEVTYQSGDSGTTTPTGTWTTTIPSVTKGQYLWTRVITTYTDNSTSTSYSASYQGVDGVTNVTGLLTNESITLPANVGGTVTSYTGATGTFDVFEGLIKKTGTGVTYSVLSKTNIEVTIATTGVYTITSMTSGLTTLNGFAILRAIYNGVTIDKQINVAKAVTGATGATGASATSYWITASNNIIGKSQTGVINPTTITFKGFSNTGTANPVAYSGRFIIQTSTNGTTYANSYTSSADQNSYTYTIPVDSLFVKCLFYMAGGTTILLDEQTVPIVESAEGIEVGQNNLLINTKNPSNTSMVRLKGYIPSGFGTLSWSDGWTKVVVNIPTVETFYRFNSPLEDLGGLEPGETYVFSALVKGKGNLNFSSQYKDRTGGIWINSYLTPDLSLSETSPVRFTHVFTIPSNATAYYISLQLAHLSGNYFEFAESQVTKGNVPIDYKPAPEDARTYKAWANSSDGTVDFTRVYPNENLLLESNQSVTTSSYEMKNYPLADDTLTATDDVVITLKGALGADRNRFHAFNSGDMNAIGSLTSIGNGLYQFNGKWKPTGGNSFLRIYHFNSTGTSSSTIEWIKLERGTTPTVYTTNTADSLTGSVMQYVGFSPLDSSKPSDYEWIINPEWTESSSMEYTSSSIEKTSESIMTTVTESFVAEEDYKQYREDVSTQFTQTAEDFNLLFSKVSEEVKEVESGSETKFEKIEKYIRFVDGKIVLGTSDSDSILEISNDRISFKQGGNEVAHFAGQTFTISKGILTDSMQVGDHRMTQNAGGLTTFDYLP